MGFTTPCDKALFLNGGLYVGDVRSTVIFRLKLRSALVRTSLTRMAPPSGSGAGAAGAAGARARGRRSGKACFCMS